MLHVGVVGIRVQREKSGCDYRMLCPPRKVHVDRAHALPKKAELSTDIGFVEIIWVEGALLSPVIIVDCLIK